MSNVPLKPARRAALTLVGGRHAACDAVADRAPAAPDAALPPGWFEEWIGYVGERADTAPMPAPMPKRSR